ncbi:MAG: hypothetical protein JETT_0832 [Candidatus Jettenia ecosi]|uniref:Uncharacterized protein n=1 Tax=Candidatus Jettenia ecosi TaxID=2494326 RepID=A0A533QQE0_9BACT|nr:MAG: hypothetical protein JETT_0832 [Candidatus Jettenia ecosi]
MDIRHLNHFARFLMRPPDNLNTPPIPQRIRSNPFAPYS